MNEPKTPWFLNPSTVKGLTLLSWITHIISMVVIFRVMQTWVAIVCIVLYVLLEKYVGYFVDIFAFIISLIYVDYIGLFLAVLLGIGLVYPWVLKKLITVSIEEFSEEIEKNTKEFPPQKKETEQVFQDEFSKFKNTSLNLIEKAWSNTAYSSLLAENRKVIHDYFTEIFEAQKHDFEDASKEKIETILSLIFIQTFTYSYYVLLNLKYYFPEYDTNHFIFNMMEVLSEMDIFSLDLADAAKEMIENKQDIMGKTIEKFILE